MNTSGVISEFLSVSDEDIERKCEMKNDSGLLYRVDNTIRFSHTAIDLSPGQAVSEGRDIAESVMQTLGISENELIDRAYIDMVPKRAV